MLTVAAAADLIRRYGETVVLRRPGAPDIDATVKARVKGFQAAELVGDLLQGDRRVWIAGADLLAANWPVPPVAFQTPDLVLIDGHAHAVTEVDANKIGDDVAFYILTVRG